MGQNWSKWTHESCTVGIQWEMECPDPYHGVVPRYAPCPSTPLPRVPLPTSWCTDRECYHCWEARTGSPGFFRIQSRMLNTNLSKTTIFFSSKWTLSKMHFLSKMPTLRKNFLPKCHFWLFLLKMTKIDTFRDTTGFHWFFSGFHCLRGLRFCHALWQISDKFRNIYRKT